ncbi:MAG TPA: DUF4832 domain-containing protein [Planctomycetaceae bacterium]|nr:DUF4832 domain-containing protein [Planctomycetaceae bacterium]
MTRPQLAACFFLTWLQLPLANASDLGEIRIRSQIDNVQPMTGIVLWADNPKVQQLNDSISLEYRYCGYNEVVKGDGEYDFSRIDAVLDDIASRNHQAILRFHFCYPGRTTTVPDFIRERADYQETIGQSEGKKTHFCDWSNAALQAFTLEFYSQFAKRYDSDPRIAFLQTGFGLWAEYHIYSGPRTLGKTFPSKEFQTKFLKHLDTEFDNLPWSISVDAADYDYSPLEDNARLLALGFGVFDDSFLCKQHPKENAVNWRILGSDRWKRQPAGGEFSYYNRKDQKNALSAEGPNGVPFEQAARQFHISYMIGNDQPRYQNAERIQSASLATGYRFRVSQGSFNGGRLTLQVTNMGVAPLYRDAYFSAGKSRSAETLKGLLPGQTRMIILEAVDQSDLKSIRIESDAILPTQRIQFEADCVLRNDQ